MVLGYMIWLNIKSNAHQELVYSNSLMSSAVKSTLHKNESLLKILGLRLVELGALEKQTPKALELVNDLLKGNPELAGVGLANPQGQLVLTSFNIDRSRLPNLLKNPESAKSFKQTLESNSMVVGRTYFMKALNEWVIPVRYSIRDESEKVIAVMTTGIKLDSAKSLWTSTGLPDHIFVSIVRDDFYRQYISRTTDRDIKDIYASKIKEDKIRLANSFLQNHLNMTLEDMRNSNETVIVELEYSEKNIPALSAIHYDQEYQHYTLLSMPFTELYKKMITPLSFLIGLLVFFNIILFILFRSNDQLQKDAKNTLEHQANHDFLTGLPNRRFLLDSFNEWQKETEEGYYVLFIDMNNFKISNDLYGHTIGDSILREVANRLKTFYSDQSMIIRQGGDEFIVLIPQTFCPDIYTNTQKFLEHLKSPIEINELMFTMSASIGAVLSPEEGNEIEELLRKADMAMYEAKLSDDNVYIFSDHLESKQQRKAFIESELGSAIEKNELHMVYQPQVDAKTHKIVGVEALIRWNHPVLGLVPPDEFIAISENSGLIQEIGRFVLETSVREFSQICQTVNHQDQIRLSINVSVRQLLNSQFLDHINTQYDGIDCETIKLAIEVTENLFIEDIDRAKQILQQVQQSGIEISLDDFGTGYSSLSVLNQLPINELKIDKSFVRDILIDDHDRNLIQQIINLSKSLNIPVLAEGVEENAQAELLNDFGCDLFQGYYFSKPLEANDLMSFLNEH